MEPIVIDSINELPMVAKTLISSFKGKRLFAFQGAMGAGKTTLIKEICKQLHVIDVVSSPTFAIVNEYTTTTGDFVYHFDFYRIKTIEEAYDFGYEEYFFGKGICLIEWPEVIEELIPEDTVMIKIELLSSGSRKFSVETF
ncbi:tRNA (adenosine(37)-N6)-threonylcarbamoyltransferase complex ATPase subunit type 1 TsaE [Williamwhitmania taraxaci]|uniref:tRNA threonylcarbamoyladenosine biosynthesis protein TsaE n=1 Tax=Williamwhitmania taraxaci TaxID=1640674 RepID=A0A1G6LXH5_9BACT|nr:tRNA (adenosine(37)-N6)-threonylcarbamoyltransferase complex ATPase subunit type 1 TsaE [Williamwhitmania taraxaci]SDC47807.1 tRNA threonylcarbamoyladenosine biosynthesis protein TsaE [Williamwhitmania taraxaci]